MSDKVDVKKSKEAGASVAATSATSVSVPADPEKMLKEVLGAVSTLSDGMDKMLTRIGALEERFEGNRRVTMSRGGGSAEAISSEFQDGQNFFDRAQTQEGGRYSYGSTGSNFGSRDPGTKLERPKFAVKNTKITNGSKKEETQWSDFLDYFDECDQYMDAWETIPANMINDDTPRPYPGRERMAVLNLPVKYAKELSGRLKTVFDVTDLQFMTLEDVAQRVEWKKLSTQDVRRRIGLQFAKEVSTKGSVDILRRIKFDSPYGLIDANAFAKYQSDLKKEILRIQAGGSIVVNRVQIKDIIIAALPDKVYQQELYAKYGHFGTLFMNYEDFAINTIFDEIEIRIETITKQGLRAMTNKAVKERDGVQVARPGFHKVANIQELQEQWEEEIQDQVNAALMGDKKCRNVGVGSDKLLKCRFLGGEKATCTFEHPTSDLALKGKGVTRDQPAPQWLNTGRKVHHMVADTRSVFPDSDEDWWHSSDTLPAFPESPDSGAVGDE
jgi:hypothetical protein